MVAAWKEEMKRWKNILLISYVLLHLMWLAPRSVLKRAKIMIIMTTLFLQHKRCGARCLTSQRQCKYFSQQSQSMCKLYLYHKIEDINIPNDVSIHDIWIVLHNILKVQIYSTGCPVFTAFDDLPLRGIKCLDLAKIDVSFFS